MCLSKQQKEFVMMKTTAQALTSLTEAGMTLLICAFWISMGVWVLSLIVELTSEIKAEK